MTNGKKVVKMTEEAKIKYDDIQLKMQEFEEEILSVFERTG